jgi:hypothetical protein
MGVASTRGGLSRREGSSMLTAPVHVISVKLPVNFEFAPQQMHG